MASLQAKKNKEGPPTRIVQFRLGGKTKSLFLGRKYSQRQSEEVKRAVEEVVFALETGGELSQKTRYFLATVSDDLRTRFENAGLLRRERRLTCRELWDAFESAKERQGLAANTLENQRTNRFYFFRFFDEGRYADEITLADAKDWVAALPGFRRRGVEPLSSATLRGAIKTAKTVFNWAVENELLEKSVFDKRVRGGDWINKSRERYVTPSEYYRLLDAAPNKTWRVIIALSRIGALRCPSETTALRWSNIRWNDGVFVVHSSKSGKDRLTPLFPELRVELQALFDERNERGDDSPFVLGAGYRQKENLRTRFARIIGRAGLEVWERIFHNLRGSRSNELFSHYPIPQVERWIEQSFDVARQHYLHSTPGEFKKAVEVKSFLTELEDGAANGTG